MKVKEKSLREKFSPLCLFLDDLYFIEEILKKDNNTITIETEDYTFSSINEVKEKYNNQTINNLKIRTGEPYISIDLSPSYANIYSSKDDDASISILYKIKKELRKSEKKPRLFYSFWPLVIGLNSFVVLSSVSKIESYLPKTTWLLLGAIILSWYTYASYTNLRKYSEIKIVRRSEEKNFFIEKKHDLFLVFIGVVLATFFDLLFK